MSSTNTMKKVSGVDNTITGFVLGIILINKKGVCEGGKKTKKATWYVLLVDDMTTFCDH